jgi:hypothetical protein
MGQDFSQYQGTNFTLGDIMEGRTAQYDSMIAQHKIERAKEAESLSQSLSELATSYAEAVANLDLFEELEAPDEVDSIASKLGGMPIGSRFQMKRLPNEGMIDDPKNKKWDAVTKYGVYEDKFFESLLPADLFNFLKNDPELGYFVKKNDGFIPNEAVRQLLKLPPGYFDKSGKNAGYKKLLSMDADVQKVAKPGFSKNSNLMMEAIKHLSDAIKGREEEAQSLETKYQQLKSKPTSVLTQEEKKFMKKYEKGKETHLGTIKSLKNCKSVLQKSLEKVNQVKTSETSRKQQATNAASASQHQTHNYNSSSFGGHNSYHNYSTGYSNYYGSSYSSPGSSYGSSSRSSHSTSSHSMPSSGGPTVYTGPRGGTYTYNSSGGKTYFGGNGYGRRS